MTFYSTAITPTPINILGDGDDRIEFNNVALVDGIFDLNLMLTPTQLEGIFGGSTAVFIHLEYCDDGVDDCDTPGYDTNWITTLDRQQFTFAPYCLKLPVDATNLGWTSDGNLLVTNLGRPSYH